jgi:O-antigen/teichoic acid export membrane protein
VTTRYARVGPSLLTALGWYGVSYGLAIVGYLAINAIASRWLGTSEFGAFVIATSAAAGIGQFALLGSHRAGLRDAATSDGDPGRLQDLRGSAASSVLLALPLFSVASAVVAYFVASGSSSSRLVYAIAFGGLVYTGGLQKLWASYLRGFGNIRLASLFEGRSGGAIIAVGQGVVMFIAWRLFPHWGVAGAMMAASVGFALPVIYAWVVTGTHWRHLPRTGDLWGHTVSTFHRSWRFGVNQAATFLAGTVELWIGGALLSGHDSSLFSASFRLAFMLSIPLTSLQVVFAPLCARMLARGDKRQLENVLRTGASFATVASSVLLIPMLVAPAELLVLVFGPGFGAGSDAFLLLTIGNIANIVSGLAGTVLTMSHREGLAAAVQTVTLAGRIVIGSFAAWQWGLIGLAGSAALHSVLMFSYMWWSARKHVGVFTHPTLRPQWRVLRSTGA